MSADTSRSTHATPPQNQAEHRPEAGSTVDTQTSALLAAAEASGVDRKDLPRRVDPTRLTNIEGTLNFRELGGIKVDGGTVRRGIVFRSDQLSGVTDAGLATFAALGLQRVYDFRLPVERERQPSRLPAGLRVDHVATGDLSAAEDMVSKVPLMLNGHMPMGPPSFWDDSYIDLLHRAAPMFLAVVRGLGQPEGTPALYHCTGGKDRTGLTTMLILRAIGGDDEDIADDFLATNVFRTPERLPFWRAQFEAAGITVAQAMPIVGVTRSGIETALAELDRMGGALQYLRDGGMTDTELTQLHDNLVAPN